MQTESDAALAVEVRGLCKTFGKTKALNNIDLCVKDGEMVALIGASGSGKSTFLKHLSGLMVGDDVDSEIHVLSNTIQLCGDLTTRIRQIRARVGFIFQQFNLVGRLSLITNVLAGMLAQVPLWRSVFRWFSPKEKMMALLALQKVGMDAYASQRASTLSGGQQQRGAIARALVQGAELILADEPIASLDPESSRKVMRTLQQINQENGITVMVSLHQVDFAMQFCPRIIGLKNGCIMFDGPSSELTTALLQDLYGSEFSDVEEGIDIYAHVKKNKQNRAKQPIPERGLENMAPQLA